MNQENHEESQMDQEREEPPSSILKFKKDNAKSWNDWKWQLSNSIKDIKSLNMFYDSNYVDLNQVIKTFPMSITPYYMSVMCSNLDGKLAKMFVPDNREIYNGCHSSDDPLHEEDQMPVRNLVHRYPDRVLVITTAICPNYCRYCIRKRRIDGKAHEISKENLLEISKYISSHPEIKDVILSGGDMLCMSDKKIGEILEIISSIDTIDIIRIGTKIPIVLPQRITNSLVSILKRCKKPIYINTHFNHPDEVTEESSKACLKLANSGIPMGNQSVMLKGINNDSNILASLYTKLLKIKVKPYYIYQCDEITGASHFKTDVRDSMKIVFSLRGKISGMAIPNLILDSPGGLGKIQLHDNSIIKIDDEEVILRNSKGKIVNYSQPS